MASNPSPLEVPFFGLARQFERYRDEFMAITERSLASGQVLQGPEVDQFETSLARICGRAHAVAVGSCTDALAFALIAAGVGPGDEVLITGTSFVASVSPILRVGAVPRFVDIELAYYLMDLGVAERLVTPKTKAIIAVHLYGQTLPMASWEAFASAHKLTLIEDAAQALGAKDNGRPAGSMGQVSCISFDPTKVIASFGSAGALLTDDPASDRKARMLRYHGRDPKTRTYETLGFNSQLASSMAGMLAFKLEHLAEWENARDRIARRYLGELAGLPQLVLPAIRPGSTHNWHKFVLRAERRDALAKYLKEAGIQTMVHYARALTDEPLIKALGLSAEATHVPHCLRHAHEALSLPVFAEMTDAEATHVASSVRRFYETG